MRSEARHPPVIAHTPMPYARVEVECASVPAEERRVRAHVECDLQRGHSAINCGEFVGGFAEVSPSRQRGRAGAAMPGASRICGLRRRIAVHCRAAPRMSRRSMHRRPRSGAAKFAERSPEFTAPATWRSLPARLSRVRTLGKLSLFLGSHHSSHAEYLRDTAEI